VANSVKAKIVEELPKLRKFALALTGCPDRGEELSQETCAKALARAHQWREGTRLDSWLYRIAQNHWIDTMRSSHHRRAVVPIDDVPIADDASATNSAFSQHQHHAIREAVAALPEDQRVVVALVCIQGCAYREAADILEIPVGTVMSRLARARKSLHRKLYGDDVAQSENG
jgi:RNA polymerase sigma-70 factor, ECF subfamily